MKSIDLSTMVKNNPLNNIKIYAEREMNILKETEAFNNDHRNFIDGELKQLQKILKLINNIENETTN